MRCSTYVFIGWQYHARGWTFDRFMTIDLKPGSLVATITLTPLYLTRPCMAGRHTAVQQDPEAKKHCFVTCLATSRRLGAFLSIRRTLQKRYRRQDDAA